MQVPPIEQNSAQPWVPETEAERSAIREQLDRVLSSPQFKNSKRYPNLLRFAVERALKGHTEPLKERTVGIEVFGREPDYDTNLDPIVRTTAVEIRKRIAQYYHEHGHETEIRIDFPPGSYMPEFRMPSNPVVVIPPEPAEPTAPKRNPLVIIAFPALIAIVLAIALWRWWPATSQLDRFWSPVIAANRPVTIYIGQVASGGAVNSLMELQQAEQVAFADATAMARLTGLLAARNREFRFRLQPSSNIEDLRDGPTILIGAFNNSWALRLTGQLRFGFNRNFELHESWIQDRQEPGARKWLQKMNAPYDQAKEDYAIVSRVVDPTTGNFVVTASGISKFGTEAAGEFLTCEPCMKEMSASAPPDWFHKNVEVVIGASVVGRAAGPPHVVALHVW